MKFRTEIKIKGAPGFLDPERLIVLAGSCFSDNIGSRMKERGWPALINPCGVIYNPVSMALLFRLALLNRAMRRDIVAGSITSREGRYVSWFMGSKIISDSPEGCVDGVCEALDALEEGIEKAQALILTFGTADVWLIAGTDRAVGNCHKHPASEFERRRASVGETVAVWRELIDAVMMRNPDIKIILTVSPRRYLSDGFEQNSRLKAVLLLACEELCNSSGLDNVFYFPAYEIMNDDLRDYRFYTSDLLHPSEMAVDYIWEKFCDCFVDEKGKDLLKANMKIHRREGHIPLK